MVVRTFAAVFPAVSLWEGQLGSDFLLIGALTGDGAPTVSYHRLAAIFDEPRIRADLGRIATAEPADLLGWYVAEGDAVRASAGPGPVNTVDRNGLEFSVPRAMRLGPGMEIYTEIDALRHHEAFPWVEGMPSAEVVERANARRRDAKFFVATQVNAFVGAGDAALDYYRQIECREGPVACRRARVALTELAWSLLGAGKAEGARSLAAVLSADDPADPATLAWAKENLRRLDSSGPAGARSAAGDLPAPGSIAAPVGSQPPRAAELTIGSPRRAASSHFTAGCRSHGW